MSQKGEHILNDVNAKITIQPESNFDPLIYQSADARRWEGGESESLPRHGAPEANLGFPLHSQHADEINTRQFPSDALFYKAMNANPSWSEAPWQSSNAGQDTLLEALRNPRVAELAKSLPADMLDAMAGDTKSVNDFLQKKGFGRLLQEGDPNEEAVAATMTIKRDWEAQRSNIRIGEKNYPAVDKGESQIFNVDGKPVVKLYSGDDGIGVYAIPNDQKITGFQAMAEAKSLIPRTERSLAAVEGIVRIPMIDLESKESLDWLIGMNGGDLSISQAVMQTKLKMDESGFDAEQALAMGATRSFNMSPEPKYTFRTNFTFVVAKDGQPIFAQPVTKEDWKDPKRK